MLQAQILFVQDKTMEGWAELESDQKPVDLRRNC